MKIFGIEAGYDDPFWYFGAWEFGLFDAGWIVARRRLIILEGRWPRYTTFHRKKQ